MFSMIRLAHRNNPNLVLGFSVYVRFTRKPLDFAFGVKSTLFSSFGQDSSETPAASGFPSTTKSFSSDERSQVAWTKVQALRWSIGS
jgi:hypothetical protein